MKKIMIFWGVLAIIPIWGEIQCIQKAIACNWQPVGKAEIVYTAAACTGFGAIVGWIDIADD